MFIYDKKLQYPVRIANTNPRLAAIIISQYGGPDGELGASLRYLSQRYSMPFDELKGLLTDIGTGIKKRHPFNKRFSTRFRFLKNMGSYRNVAVQKSVYYRLFFLPCFSSVIVPFVSGFSL